MTAAVIPGQAPTNSIVGYFKGFIQPVSSSEMFMMAKSAENATHRLYTNLGTDIVKGDKINQNSTDYVVIADITQPTGVSGVDHHREILLGLIK